jgi:hypothetical protein
LSRVGHGRYVTRDDRFTVTRKDHPLLEASGSPLTWIVTDTSGARPFRDSTGRPVAQYWTRTLGDARQAMNLASQGR